MKKHYKLIITILVIAVMFPVVAYADCPLGENVTKDLSGILRIMKILAPILIILYTLYEVIYGLTQGSIEDEGKKILQKFYKRVGAAVLLFVIPILVDQVMIAMNIWDESGRCTFEGEVTEDYNPLGTNQPISVTPPVVSVESTNANTPSVDAGSIGSNTPSVDADSTGSNTPTVDAGAIGPNTPQVQADMQQPSTPAIVIN